MITIDKLQQFGADTREGLGRCMNNEAFYLRLVNMQERKGIALNHFPCFLRVHYIIGERRDKRLIFH